MNPLGLIEFRLGDRHLPKYKITNETRFKMSKPFLKSDINVDEYLGRGWYQDLPVGFDEGDDMITTLGPEPTNLFMTPEELCEYRYKWLTIGTIITTGLMILIMLSIKYFNG